VLSKFQTAVGWRFTRQASDLPKTNHLLYDVMAKMFFATQGHSFD
jgi:hypothetical protein